MRRFERLRRRHLDPATSTTHDEARGRGRLGVLFLHTATQPPLGADTWVQSEIIRHLDRSQFDVSVACAFEHAGRSTNTYDVMAGIPETRLVPANLGPELATARSVGLVRVAWQTLPAISTVARLAWMIHRDRIAVIHTTDRPRDALVAVLLGKFTRATSIVHAHVAYNPEWMSSMLRWSILHADHTIAISQYVASTLIDGGRSSRTVHLVLNGIDTERWTPGVGRQEGRDEFGYDADDTVLICVCRLFPAKGPADLIRAVAIASERCAKLRLLVVGHEMTAGYRAELESLAAQLGIADQVVFAGRRSDVPQLMAAADVYAMPSQWEPFGLVFAEAMAMQLPVIALDNGGTPEVVSHEATGLLSAPGDLQALADHIVNLAADPERRQAMGERGRQRVLDTFRSERMADDAAAVYRSVASVVPA